MRDGMREQQCGVCAARWWGTMDSTCPVRNEEDRARHTLATLERIAGALEDSADAQRVMAAAQEPA